MEKRKSTIRRGRGHCNIMARNSVDERRQNIFIALEDGKISWLLGS